MDRSLRWSQVLALLLLPLFGGLAYLQFRWIHEASLFEARRQATALDNAGRDFAEALRRELQDLDELLGMPSELFARRDWAAYGDRVDRVRADARLAPLVRGIYLLDGKTAILRKYDEVRRDFVEAGSPLMAFAPEERCSLVDGLVELRKEGKTVFLRSLPVHVVPPRPSAQRPAARLQMRTVAQVDYLVLELDRQVFGEGLLAGLVDRHFGTLLGDYLVTVRGEEEAIIRRGAPYRGLPGRPPDLTQQLRVPVALERYLGGPADRSGSMTGRVVTLAGELPAPPLRLEIHHALGSTAEAARALRSRNLALSFGILGVLAGSLVVLLEATWRTRRLAFRERQFIASVSHELKTPLAVLLSAGENLEAGIVTEPANVRRYGEAIRAEGNRLREMVDKILGFSRLEEPRREPGAERFDPEAVLEVVLKRLQPLAERRGATFRRTSASPGLRVRGRRTDLDSILENLLGNALKHGMPIDRAGDWEILLETGPEPHRAGTWWACAVQDPGPGVPRRERRRIFAPFRRGARAEEEQTPGSGLGLAIARECARAMGGEVYLDPQASAGARFVLRLPAEEEA